MPRLAWRRAALPAVTVAAVAFLTAGCPFDSTEATSPQATGPAISQPATKPPATTQTATAEQASDLTGTWNGTWQNITPDQSAGTFAMTWTQQGSALSGNITITGTPCLDGGSVTGNRSGQQITFGAVQGQVSVAYTGTVAGSTMSGAYSTGCGDAQGTWTAQKK